MATGDDLLLRRSRCEFKTNDSVFRDQGQERGERDFAVTERQVILMRAAAIMNMGAKHARRTDVQRLVMIVPAQKFLQLRMPEIVPISHHLRGERGEYFRKFLLVGKFLELLPDFDPEADFLFSRERDQRFQARLDSRPYDREFCFALAHGLDL